MAKNGWKSKFQIPRRTSLDFTKKSPGLLRYSKLPLENDNFVNILKITHSCPDQVLLLKYRQDQKDKRITYLQPMRARFGNHESELELVTRSDAVGANRKQDGWFLVTRFNGVESIVTVGRWFAVWSCTGKKLCYVLNPSMPVVFDE